MSALLHWLTTGVVHGTLFFAAAWLISVTLLRQAHPATRAALFALVLIKFVIPFGPTVELRVPTALEPAASAIGRVTITAGAQPTTDALSSLLLALWGLGVLALTSVQVVRHVKHLRALPVAAPAEVLARVAALAARVGVRAPRVVTHPSGPCLVGVWRPRLVLPLHVSGAALDAMVLHELAHLRRRDPALRAVQAAVETLFFFWPVVRLAGRQLALAREQACDLDVVESGAIDRAAYAELLLELGLASSPSLAMAAHPTHLERRIDMLLKTKNFKSRRLVVAGLAVAGLVGSGVSMASAPVAQSVPAPTPRLQVSPGLDARLVQTLIAMNVHEVTGCYDAYLVAHPQTEGRLQLHWGVREDGTVDEACQSTGTTIPMELGRCVSDRVSSWRFPSPGPGQRGSIEYTFDFTLPKRQL